MRRWLPRTILYLLFFLAAGALCIAFGFPSARLDALVNERLAASTGGSLSVEGSRYRFPLSLTAERLTFSGGGRAIPLGRLTLTPRPLTLPRALFGVPPSWSVLLDGDWGRLPLALSLERGGPWKAQTAGGSVDLSLHPALSSLPVSLSGKASPSFRLSGVRGSLEGAGGEGDLLLTQVAVKGPLLEAFGLPSLSLPKVQLPCTLEKGVLTIKDGRSEGDFAGTLAGSSRLAPASVPLSSLDFTLSMRPSGEVRAKLGQIIPALGQPFVVRLTGTLAQPALSLNPGK